MKNESKKSRDAGDGRLITTCCLRIETNEKGMEVIVWRGSDNTKNVKRLTQENLKKKLQNYSS